LAKSNAKHTKSGAKPTESIFGFILDTRDVGHWVPSRAQITDASSSLNRYVIHEVRFDGDTNLPLLTVQSTYKEYRVSNALLIYRRTRRQMRKFPADPIHKNACDALLSKSIKNHRLFSRLRHNGKDRVFQIDDAIVPPNPPQRFDRLRHQACSSESLCDLTFKLPSLSERFLRFRVLKLSCAYMQGLDKM